MGIPLGRKKQCPTAGDWDMVSLSENLLEYKAVLRDTQWLCCDRVPEECGHLSQARPPNWKNIF